MTEQADHDPWTDEVCQGWLDQALVEARKTGLNTAELNIYFEAHAPNAVLNYLLQATLDGRSTGGVILVPRSTKVGINGYSNDKN